MTDTKVMGYVKKKYACRTRNVSHELMQKQCTTIVAREIVRLMEISFERLLTKDESNALRNYLEITQILGELRKIDAMTPSASKNSKAKRYKKKENKNENV